MRTSFPSRYPSSYCVVPVLHPQRGVFHPCWEGAWLRAPHAPSRSAPSLLECYRTPPSVASSKLLSARYIPECVRSCTAERDASKLPSIHRRALGLSIIAAICAAATPEQALASKLPAFADRAWEALGGGPADLYFPDDFLGVWDVTSVLAKVETPLGSDYVPDMKVVQRAMHEDLDKPIRYQVKFVHGPDGRVIFDRRFNTASMLSIYYGPTVNFQERIQWNPRDPNVLQLYMPKGMSVRSRVTRRSEDFPKDDRIDTSEYFEQVYEAADAASPRVKASQCFTKYRFRSSANAAASGGGPAIVATQVVSDFLTPFNDQELYLKSMNRPVVSYTYRMAFTRSNTAT